MGFTEAIRICLSNYATFTGRARRAEFWWFFLFLTLVGIVTSGVDMMLWTPVIDPITNLPATPQYVSGLVSLALLLPALAVAARRLHDINRSGWWQFLVYGAIAVMLLLMMIMGLNMRQPSPILILPMILPLLAGIVLLVWYATRGDVGTNRFGADPLTTGRVSRT